MIGVVFKVMWLRLWRDKGALTLAFLLPGLIFAVFATIFSNASGGNLDLRVAMAVTTWQSQSLAYADHIKDQASFSLDYNGSWTHETIKDRVRLGENDVGFIISGDITDPKTSPIIIIEDPSRKVAASVLKGQLRQYLADITTQTAPQTEREALSQSSALTSTAPSLFVHENALDQNQANQTQINPSQKTGPKDPSVTYYIGATAILFLLFSAMQGAAITLDERKSGIADRMLVGPIGAGQILLGKYVFLTLIGVAQTLIVLAVAYIFFDVTVTGKVIAVMLACLSSASIASAFALFIASICASTQQMHTVSTFLVLLFSALGGSMVPRFMMPEWLQSFGRLTPNSWSIDGFYGSLARGQSAAELMPVWGVLFGGSFVLLVLAIVMSHKLMRV